MRMREMCKKSFVGIRQIPTWITVAHIKLYGDRNVPTPRSFDFAALFLDRKLTGFLQCTLNQHLLYFKYAQSHAICETYSK